MDRTTKSSLTLVAVIVGALLAGLLARAPEKPAAAADASADAAQASDPKLPPGVEPAFKDWTTPSVVLVLTGQQNGYLEPCGCTENQSGGLARRADLFHQMWGRKWPTVAVDIGGILSGDRLSREQGLLKLEFFRKALQHMHYSGIALGQEELRLGPDKLFELYSMWSSEDAFNLPFLSANVVLLSSREIGTPQEFRIIEAGGWKIGVTSVIGRSRVSKELQEVDESLLRIEDPLKALPAVLQKLNAQRADLKILLASADDEEAKALALAFPDFRIVVSAGGPEDPIRDPQYVGDTLFVQTGRKGKHAACVGLFGPKNQAAMKFELVELDRLRFANAPEMVDLMREYQQQIQEQRPDRQFVGPLDREADFVGVDQCKACHKKAFDVWQKTAHAEAFASLTSGRPDEKPEDVVDRKYDPECLACHVTGWSPQQAWRLKGGFVDMAKTPQLANQQCENCHGPGGHHVQLEEVFRKSQQASDVLDRARAEMRQTRSCDECHDHDNSPHFQFEKYWHGSPEFVGVEHEGVD